MRGKPVFSRQRAPTNNGRLRTPVTFYTATIEEGLDGRDTAYEQAFFCLAESYGSSTKDIEIATSKGKRATTTLRIRDPLGDYQPDVTHFVSLDDFRYQGKMWEIVDVRPDLVEQAFIVIVLGGVADD